MEFKEYNRKSKSELTDDEIKNLRVETWDSLNNSNGNKFLQVRLFVPRKKRQGKEGKLPTVEKVKSEYIERKSKELLEQKIELDFKNSNVEMKLHILIKLKDH